MEKEKRNSFRDGTNKLSTISLGTIPGQNGGSDTRKGGILGREHDHVINRKINWNWVWKRLFFGCKSKCLHINIYILTLYFFFVSIDPL